MSQIIAGIQKLITPFYAALPKTRMGRLAAVCAVAFAALAAWLALKGAKRGFTATGPNPLPPLEKLKPLPAPQGKSFSSSSNFAHADTAGFGFIADVKGPANPEKVRLFFEAFSRAFVKNLDGRQSTQDEWKKFLLSAISGLDQLIYQAIEYPSTFSLAFLTAREGKKFVTIAHLGDSSLFHVQGQKLERMTSSGKDGVNQLKLGHLWHDSEINAGTFEVQPGDVIYGMPRAITDFLKDDDLQPLLTGEFSFEKLKEAIKSKIDDPQHDIGLFYIVVP